MIAVAASISGRIRLISLRRLPGNNMILFDFIFSFFNGFIRWLGGQEITKGFGMSNKMRIKPEMV
jgi:hypothetical protein